MGKYIKICFENEEEKKEIINNFKRLYEKHASLNPSQFIDDFGNFQNPEEFLNECQNKNYNYFELKIGVLNKRFFTDAFISDLTHEILSY